MEMPSGSQEEIGNLGIMIGAHFSVLAGLEWMCLPSIANPDRKQILLRLRVMGKIRCRTLVILLGPDRDRTGVRLYAEAVLGFP